MKAIEFPTHPHWATLATAVLLGALAATWTAPARAQQKPPSERRDIDPASRTKVGTALSRSRIDRQDGARQVNEARSSNMGGKNCSTNIGTSPTPSKSEVGQRYGAGNKGNQVVVVRGPVINVCK